MRLKQIKLAGFKSFVDPTSFDVPSSLVGVVGPNGCGKSNIMDAVRWVLGESRASELRGDSMQDVIFNGSDQRRPAGRASVELVFDNSAGRVGGAWSRFAELAVRRVLTRDGQSSYYINNQAVRRRDVHDIFLGTGLGPRAYAIIGQGTVSRIIEAKPEELRVFLEEAAGVTKYKERRRETEQRLADARDNLTRVDDVLRELDAQIERLARQAEVAARFRELEAERAAKQHTLWLVRRDAALADAQQLAQAAGVVRTELEARRAEQHAAELALERLHVERDSASDATHAAQAAYYEANGEVARLEAQIRFVTDAREQAARERQAAAAQASAAAGRRDAALAGIEQARQEAEEAQATEDTLSAALEQHEHALPAAEARAAAATGALETARSQVAALGHAIEVARTRQRAADDARRGLVARRDRLEAELAAVRAPAAEQLEQAAARLAELQHTERDLAAALADGDRAGHDIDAQRTQARSALQAAQAQLAQTQARLSALSQLQERLQNRSRIAPWLARHGLDSAAGFWQRVQIEPGWEAAVEAVLRERVSALEAGRDKQAALADDPPPARCAVFTAPDDSGRAGIAPLAAELTARPPLPRLAQLVRGADPAIGALLADWLHGVFTADTLADALSHQHLLPPGSCIVVRGGHVVRRDSLQLHAPDGEQDGMLARRREIEDLSRQARAQQLLADEAAGRAQQADAAHAAHDAAQRELRGRHARAVRDAAAAQVEHERLVQASRQAGQTRGRIESDLADVAEALAGHEQTLEHEAGLVDAHDADLAEREDALERLRQSTDAAQRALASAREQLRQVERELQEASFARRAAQTRIAQLERDAQAAGEQSHEASERAALIDARLAELDDASARETLQQALAVRVQREQALSVARDELERAAERTRAVEGERLTAERAQAPLRDRVAQLQMDEQAARLTAEQFSQQLLEAQCDEQALRAQWPTMPKPAWLAAETTRLAQAIAALGAVNLAALDELDEARTRKGFLDAQHADLSEAVTTLEDAIRRIDRETRALLKDTFDAVDREFGRLFPRLFGGGEARLLLTGDEILDAGVTVMAQPPGKRNSTIHLLSGGEKALTAIALVFAMFQLNPAPFCLLDEVDAPLDDANTERYVDMVRSMSDQTQFLFITHNKIAMELAQQLVGVTMQERGVSRIVAVDLQAAGRFAQAA